MTLLIKGRENIHHNRQIAVGLFCKLHPSARCKGRGMFLHHGKRVRISASAGQPHCMLTSVKTKLHMDRLRAGYAPNWMHTVDVYVVLYQDIDNNITMYTIEDLELLHAAMGDGVNLLNRKTPLACASWGNITDIATHIQHI